jgi:hypothetical protein
MSIILKVGSGGKCLGAYRDLGNRELPLGVTGWLLATKESFFKKRSMSIIKARKKRCGTHVRKVLIDCGGELI